MLLSEITCNSVGKNLMKLLWYQAWLGIMLKKFDATTAIPWEFICYDDRERKTKPITQSKRIVFDVKKYSCFIRKYTTSALARCWENLYYTCLWIICLDVVWITMKYDPKHNVILYYTQNPRNPFHVSPPIYSHSGNA